MRKYIQDVEKGTKQVVEFVGAEGKAPKTNVQDDYKFKGKYHVVTKETVWKEKTHAYNSVDVPVVKGYFADKKQAGGETLTPEKPEVQPSTPQTNTDNPEAKGQTLANQANATNAQTLANQADSTQPETDSPAQKILPNTGTEKVSFLALVGISLLALLGLGSFLNSRKEK